jgi:hypothetical protein
MEFVLNQFPRDSQHVSRLPCKGVPIFLEEFDEREFLFGIQGVAYVSNLEGFSVDNGICLLSASSSRMDVLEVSESGMIGSRGDSAISQLSQLSLS